MSSFAAQWLALREPYDIQARNAAVLDAVSAEFGNRTSLAIVDLAAGAGATLRAIASRLPARQDWRMVDNDLSLLARVNTGPINPQRNVAVTPIDLAHDLEAALDGPVDLVTLSALLDLVSSEWLGRLIIEVAARGLPLYAALTYDGRITFNPSEPDDEKIVAAVNAHQRRDKGFGPALGPGAAAAAIARFESIGWRVMQGVSDWTFGPHDGAIQTESLTGWASAARETGTISMEATARWLTRRREHVTAGRSSIRVGHVDFFARPMQTR